MTDEDRIAEALARLLERVERGESVSEEDLVAEDPEMASQLRAKFGAFQLLDRVFSPAHRRPPPEGESVLESLSRAGAPVASVFLRDAPADDSSPVAIPQPSKQGYGRYEVSGEIARGGVGLVLKARDPDLGRDVAVKVLRDEHAARPDLVQRFVEEAQVGGQLQHPGIVPVYELGLRSDGRPFFAMKLIKGRTMASLLTERSDPGQDRPRFLSMFHSVCQTIAYAHARGVVHRDLKPSNVMTGGFGEIQVVDWGMAKVLARGGVADEAERPAAEPGAPGIATVRTRKAGSESVVGSVLGTPRFMSPEQAQGEVERLDERTDVFALGAILCEILTGHPPYTGAEDDVLADAAQGRLDAAHRRLAGCGADGDLVRLATVCLSASIQGRPRDAGVVAREVSRHLASVEERARASEVAAAEARAVAGQERRARRLTLALAANATAAILLAGGGWAWWTSARDKRRETADRAVSAAIDEASAGRAEARAREDASLWPGAVTKAEKAFAIAESSEAGDAVRERALASLVDARSEGARAEAAAAERRRQAEMAERLDDIERDAQEIGDDAAGRRYREAFRAYGIDLEGLSTEGLLVALRASPIGGRLVSALAHLASFQSIAVAADVDPWRSRVRATSDRPELLALAAGVDVERATVLDVRLLIDRLASIGETAPAFDLARALQSAHPGDYWASWLAGSLALQLAGRDPPKDHPLLHEAARFHTAAIAANPKGFVSWRDLGVAYARMGKHPEAKAAYERAMLLKPDEPTVHFDLGLNARDTGNLAEAAAHFAKALDLEPGYAKAHDEAGQISTLQNDFEEAKRHFLAAIRLDPKNASAHSGLASALANHRDLAGAVEEATKAIAVDPGWGHGHYVLGYARYYQGEMEKAAAAFREAVRYGRAEGSAWLGLIHHDAGDLRQALVELREAVEHESESPRSQVMARVELTLALLDAGEPEEALRNARESERLYHSSRTASALGDALAAHGSWQEARDAYSTAVKREPKDADAHAKLAASLVRTGDLAGARDAYEKVRTLQPTAAEVIAPEFALVGRLLEMERALPPEDTGLAKREVPYRVDMAELLAIRREWSASARIFESVFVEDPALFEWDLRELPSIAAVVAVEAAESAGDARWKRLAIAWLRKLVAAQAREKDPESVPDRRKSLSRLKVNPALGPIRSPKALAMLGTEDREAALLLWGEVDLLLDRLRP